MKWRLNILRIGLFFIQTFYNQNMNVWDRKTREQNENSFQKMVLSQNSSSQEKLNFTFAFHTAFYLSVLFQT